MLRNLKSLLAVAGMATVGLLAGQTDAALLGNPGYAYTYSWSTPAMHPGPSGDVGTDAYNELNGVSNILNDGQITELGDNTTGDLFVWNGALDNGVFFGTSAGTQSTITFDLGSVQQLGLVDLHSVVHYSFAVGSFSAIDAVIDGGTPINFGGLDNTFENGVPRMHQIDLTGNSGQVIQLTVTNTHEWATLNEVVFHQIPEPASMALMGLGGLLVLRRRRSH